MSIVRALGRAALGSYFILQGVRSLKYPGHLADAAEPLAEKVVPLAQKVLPDQVGTMLPTSNEAVVRTTGGMAILGGLGMVTGIATRPAGCLAATSTLPTLLSSNPLNASNKAAALPLFLRNLALTGAAMIVASDTRGRPSLAYQAGQKRALVAAQVSDAQAEAANNAGELSRRAQKKLDRLARNASKQLAVVAGDYDKLSKSAKRRLEKAAQAAAASVENARQSVSEAL